MCASSPSGRQPLEIGVGIVAERGVGTVDIRPVDGVIPHLRAEMFLDDLLHDVEHDALHDLLLSTLHVAARASQLVMCRRASWASAVTSCDRSSPPARSTRTSHRAGRLPAAERSTSACAPPAARLGVSVGESVVDHVDPLVELVQGRSRSGWRPSRSPRSAASWSSTPTSRCGSSPSFGSASAVSTRTCGARARRPARSRTQGRSTTPAWR